MNILRYQSQNNFFVGHIANIFECATLLLFYREIFKTLDATGEKYVYRRFFILVIILFAAFSVINTICWQSFTEYPTYTRTLLCIIVVFLSGFYFHKFSYEPHPKSWSEMPNYKASRGALFWINMGLLLFYGFSLMRSFFINDLLLEVSKKTLFKFETAHNILVIIFYTFMLIGFIKAKRITGKEFFKENKYKI